MPRAAARTSGATASLRCGNVAGAEWSLLPDRRSCPPLERPGLYAEHGDAPQNRPPRRALHHEHTDGTPTTDDGGATWIRQPARQVSALSQIAFVEPGFRFGAGHQGASARSDAKGALRENTPATAAQFMPSMTVPSGGDTVELVTVALAEEQTGVANVAAWWRASSMHGRHEVAVRLTPGRCGRLKYPEARRALGLEQAAWDQTTHSATRHCLATIALAPTMTARRHSWRAVR